MKTEFTDGAIGIRPYRDDDVTSLFAAVRESVNELSVWMPWCNAEYSMNDSAAFVAMRQTEWDKGEHYSFVIYDMKDHAFLGGVGLNFVNQVHKFANLGYWVRSSRTGRGVASAATCLVARFGFEVLGFNRLEIVAAAGNIASQRVAEKTGARREGLLRNRLVLHDKAHDAVMYSLIAGDICAELVRNSPGAP